MLGVRAVADVLPVSPVRLPRTDLQKSDAKHRADHAKRRHEAAPIRNGSVPSTSNDQTAVIDAENLATFSRETRPMMLSP
jgi:hypothetical protein